MSDSKTKFITMYHPDLEGTARVVEAAFTQTWEAKGWKRVTDTSGPLASKTKAELAEIARGQGHQVDDGATKAEILDKLKEG